MTLSAYESGWPEGPYEWPPFETKGYRDAYTRGWKVSERCLDDFPLDSADSRGEPESWYDGYFDAAAGRDKWHIPWCRFEGGCEEHAW